ncbi:unnamed protein product [Trichogramma brassicae]|uniref:SHSP domain-containing protein n=1 Tax=Trichogramma brassicae TaxID=86971 RepID=A0A6H5HWQ8_9HYME|nr:unnamed protein product [Trichogramma brassicae]
MRKIRKIRQFKRIKKIRKILMKHSNKIMKLKMLLRRQDRDRRHGVSRVKHDDTEFRVHLDVQQFKPEEVEVSVDEERRHLVIRAKHEKKKDEHGLISCQFARRYALPDRVELERVASGISSDGVLTISAPLKPLEKEEKKETVRRIKIEYTGKPALKEQQQHAEEEEEKQQTEQDDDEISIATEEPELGSGASSTTASSAGTKEKRQWRQQDEEKLIFLVRESPCVWARNGESKEGQIKAWRSVASSLSTVNRQITVTEAHEKWRSLLKEYREQADIKKCFEEGPEGFPWTPLWPYFEAMSFVETTNEEDTLSISSIENFPDVGKFSGSSARTKTRWTAFPTSGHWSQLPLRSTSSNPK